MPDPSLYEVLKAIEAEDQSAILLAPIGTNLVRANYFQKRGTEVTIGVAGNMVASILNGVYVGALILVKREAYDAKVAALRAAATRAPEGQPT